jgi:hypothetical protein
VAFRHADNYEAFLAVVFAVVEALDSEWSSNTVFASSKLTPWFYQFASALASCHSNPSFMIVRDLSSFVNYSMKAFNENKQVPGRTCGQATDRAVHRCDPAPEATHVTRATLFAAGLIGDFATRTAKAPAPPLD